MDSEAMACIAVIRQEVEATWPSLISAIARHMPSNRRLYERVWRYIDAGAAAVLTQHYGGDETAMRQNIPPQHRIGAIQTRSEALMALDIAARLAAESDPPRDTFGWLKSRLRHPKSG